MLLTSQKKHHSAESDTLSIFFWAIPSLPCAKVQRVSGRAIHCNSSPPRRVRGFRCYPYCKSGMNFEVSLKKIEV